MNDGWLVGLVGWLAGLPVVGRHNIPTQRNHAHRLDQWTVARIRQMRLQTVTLQNECCNIIRGLLQMICPVPSRPVPSSARSHPSIHLCIHSFEQQPLDGALHCLYQCPPPPPLCLTNNNVLGGAFGGFTKSFI